MENNAHQENPYLNKLNILLAISQIVSRTTEWKPGLDEISHLIRILLPYDYLLIHQAEANDLNQVIYAKTNHTDEPVGTEDFVWEEILAGLVMSNCQVILQQPVEGSADYHPNSPRFLGIPLVCDRCLGTLVLVRLGESAFLEEDIHLAEFIAQQVTMLIERHILSLEHEMIEDQRRQARLQEDFISNITHELRNPLGCIKGYTTTLLRQDITWDPATQREFLNIIDQETDLLRELIDNLLDSTRLQSGQMQMRFQLLRLEVLINEVIERTHLQFPDIVLHLEMEKMLSPITGDSSRLIQVMDNLVSNVIKHAPKSDIWITIIKEKDGIRITFADKGPGIPEKYLSKIFDRFFRVPEQAPNVHGSGLGLFICKQIIQAHKGQISVESQVGEGTKFHVLLPYHS